MLVRAVVEPFKKAKESFSLQVGPEDSQTLMANSHVHGGYQLLLENLYNYASILYICSETMVIVGTILLKSETVIMVDLS